MAYYCQFDDFNPLLERTPADPFSRLPSIVERARSLLAGRTHDQLVYAAQAVDWLIEENLQRQQSVIVRRIIENGSWERRHLPEDERNEDGVRQLLEN